MNQWSEPPSPKKTPTEAERRFCLSGDTQNARSGGLGFEGGGGLACLRTLRRGWTSPAAVCVSRHNSPIATKNPRWIKELSAVTDRRNRARAFSKLHLGAQRFFALVRANWNARTRHDILLGFQAAVLAWFGAAAA